MVNAVTILCKYINTLAANHWNGKHRLFSIVNDVDLEVVLILKICSIMMNNTKLFPKEKAVNKQTLSLSLHFSISVDPEELEISKYTSDKQRLSF
jgi:hypothetical protein